MVYAAWFAAKYQPRAVDQPHGAEYVASAVRMFTTGATNITVREGTEGDTSGSTGRKSYKRGKQQRATPIGAREAAD
eukprot:15465547-Alexandrium_andersonii.AAC.1